MIGKVRLIFVFCIATLLFTACNRMPDHTVYIPKDAVVVAGVNIKALGKKIAWNMITGSKLFQDMQKRMPQKDGDMMSGLDKAGIDAMNTFYVYMKTDKRYAGELKVTGLVPLSDAQAWEAYVKKSFPKAEIKSVGDLKQASLGRDMYVGWNDKLLIVSNTIPDYNIPEGAARPDMQTEMQVAFDVAKNNSAKGKENFDKLQNAGHDITLWINYEQMMNQYGNEGMASAMGGISVANTLWKDASVACGFDFKTGKITGDMSYYGSAEMSDVWKEMGSENVDKEMISRLPAKDLDMILALHLSTKGIKTMLDKTGLLGMANSTLSAQGMTVNDLMDAFTGDMAFAMNNFGLHTETTKIPMGDGVYERQDTRSDYTASYVMKLNKKDKFQKIMDLAKATGALLPYGKGFTMPMSAKDSVFVLIEGDYLVVSNKAANASAIAMGTYKADKMAPAMAAAVQGHPMAMFLDVQQGIKNIDLGKMSGSDSVLYTESRKLLTNFFINGGEYKNGAIESHMEVNFSNTEENSLIALLDYGMKIVDASSKNEVPAQDSAVEAVPVP